MRNIRGCKFDFSAYFTAPQNTLFRTTILQSQTLHFHLQYVFVIFFLVVLFCLIIVLLIFFQIYLLFLFLHFQSCLCLVFCSNFLLLGGNNEIKKT